MRRDEMSNLFLVLMMKGLMYHNIACVLVNAASEKPLSMDLKLFLIVIPLFVFALIRRKCGKIFDFLLFHAVISGIFILLFPSMEERIIAAVCVIFMALDSMRRRLAGNTEDDCPPAASAALFIISYLAAGQMQRQQVMQICYYEAFLFLILFVAYRNLAKLTGFLKYNERMENLPAEQMKGINKMMLAVFILFFVAGMLLMPYLPVDSLLMGAVDIFWMMVRGFGLLIQWISSGEEMQTEFSPEKTEGAVPFIEAKEPSVLAKILEWIFITAGYVLLAAAAVYLAGRILYEIYKRFYDQHKEAADESEFIWKNPLVKERTERQRQKKERVTGRSVNQKMRRLYKKSIRRQFGAKAVIPTALTPMELEHAALEANENAGDVWNDSQVRTRVGLYEKARYSQYECDKQDMEAMKQNLTR